MNFFLPNENQLGSNGALVDSMDIEDDEIKEAFLRVDRADFLPLNMHEEAYANRPLKTAIYHQSAPSIYHSVLSNFNLNSNNLTLLNIGSGTGYFQTLCAVLMGESGDIHGIDIRQELVDFANEAFHKWSQKDSQRSHVAKSTFINCDGFTIHPFRNIQYDRIYIGAGIAEYSQYYFEKLLNFGGILIAPIGGSLSKVVKSADGTITKTVISRVNFAPLLGQFVEDECETRCVNVLTPMIWAPIERIHSKYTHSFKKAALVLLILQNRDKTRSLFAHLPVVLVHQIIAFCSRDWFDKDPSEIDILKGKLSRERAARRELELKLEQAEQERDQAMHLCILLRRRFLELHAAQNQQDNGNNNAAFALNPVEINHGDDTDDDMDGENDEVGFLDVL